MKHISFILFLFCLCTLTSNVTAQTIIDLQNGGKVRSKNINDYKKEDVNIQLRRAKDSVAYNRCLVVALNEAYAGRLDTAETYLKEALKLCPDAESNHVVYDMLGRICTYRGDSVKAIEQFTRALRIKPSYVPSRLMRAEQFQVMNNHAKCIEDCTYLLERHSESMTDEEKIKAYFMSAVSHFETKQYDKALAYTKELLQKSPQNKEALLLEALITEQMGRRQEAREKITTLIYQNPDDTDLYLERAQMYERDGLFDLAILDLEAVLKLNPGQKDIKNEIKRIKMLRK